MANVGNAFQESWNKLNIPVLLEFSSITSGASLLPKLDCHDSHEYGDPGSDNDVTNLTPNSEKSSSNPSTMGAFD